MNSMAKFRVALAVLALTSMLVFITGCNKNESTLGGALLGGITGAVIGGATKGPAGAAVGAAIGVAGGAVAGNIIGENATDTDKK